MKTKINMGRWSELDDKLLARIVIEGVRNGSTQTKEFERAGYALNRTSKACGFRWNKTLRPEYKDAFKQAVKEHRLRTGKIRSMRVLPHISQAVAEYHTSVEEEVAQVHPGDAKLIEENSAKPEAKQMTWNDYVDKYMPDFLDENRAQAQERVQNLPDERYNEPKSPPTIPEDVITKVINETEIYRRAKTAINTAQRTQVAYGIQKYPNPLNADTWSTVETIDHIISESIDKLHYLVMLRIKLEQQGE